jgi:hypothetical protein
LLARQADCKYTVEGQAMPINDGYRVAFWHGLLAISLAGDMPSPRLKDFATMEVETVAQISNPCEGVNYEERCSAQE